MRIVVWNCGRKLAGKKLKALENLEPDLAIVAECASPDRLWGKQPLLAPIPMQWIGDDENRGLGILAFNGYRVLRCREDQPELRWMLPVEVRGPVEFHLLAVWAMPQRASKSVSEELGVQPLQGVERYRKFLSAVPAVVAGDFHNNIGSDHGIKAVNHIRLAAGLERLGLASAYHVGQSELHGKETQPTFYEPKRTSDGPRYHVDYCFLPLEWCSHLRQVELGSFETWVGSGLSDHVPLVVDLDVPSSTPARPSRSAKTARTDLEGVSRTRRKPSQR